MCRHEMGNDERLPEEPEEGEDDNEDEEDEEDEEEDRESIPDFNEEEHALWVFRKTFQMLDDNDSIVPTGRVDKGEDLWELRWRARRTDNRHSDEGYETA